MTKKTTAPPPAYFLSLSLENVRSFGEKQTIHFTEGGKEGGRPAQWTIILGDNGVGKTTVLKALAYLMAGERDVEVDHNWIRPAYFNLRAFAWEIIRGDGIEAIMSSTMQAGLLLSDVFSPKLVTSNGHELKFTPLPDDKVIGALTWQGFNHDYSGLICYGYGASRVVGVSTLASVNMAIQNNCISLFDDKADLLNPEEWFMQLEYISFKDKISDGRAGQLLKKVREALLQVLPDVEEIEVKPTYNHQQQLEFKTPYGWVRLRDMSLGYQTLVVWLTDFASKLFIRYPDSPNPLEEPAIVLIDEIDLHLHPSWQRKLIGFLSGIFKNTQFIATAHSPLVVQAAGDAKANVVLLKREGDQTVVVQNLPDVHRWRVDQILSSELFEDASPLSPQTEKDLQRRNELLLKKRLTPKQKEELERLNQELTNQPTGTTRAERRAEDLLAQLARNLGDQDLLP
jgi:energy-coupling factor transporter ATP-binding protein EcfA2